MKAILSLALACFIASASAQESDASAQVDDQKTDGQKADYQKVDYQKWGGLPALAYKEETGLKMGGLVIYYLPPIEGTTKPRNITNAVLYSTKNQTQIYSSPSIYFGRDRKHYQGELNAKLWPTSFYGVGDEPQFEDFPEEGQSGILHYSENITFDNLYEMSPNGTIWLGVEQKFYWEKIYWTKPQAMADAGFQDILGYDGGITSGLGGMVSYDTRDNLNSSRSGFYSKVASYVYHKGLGSDFNFLENQLDIRYFIPLPGDRVIGMRSYQVVLNGDVPFKSLASTDGSAELRGIARGFYQDKQLSSYQLEYRGTPLPWRFGYRVFYDAAQVRSNFDELKDAKFQHSYGLGIRWALNPERRFNVRVELAMSEHGFSPVIDIKEAF